MRTVFLDYETVRNGDSGLDPSAIDEVAGAVRYCDFTEESQIAERIGAADIVLLNKVKLSRTELGAAPDLKLIVLSATGTDNIDLKAAKELGIAVCNVRGYCTASVAQHVWALILSLTQHLSGWHRLAVDGSWARGEFNELAYPIRELAGRTLGIVGWGELGRAVAKAAEAFGMRVIVCNRPGTAPVDGRVPLEELLATADVVSLHCPLTPSSRGLIGTQELARMKPDALLINTARGALVDGAALALALKEGRLGGAGIDVLPAEPPADDEPLIDPGIPNLIVTPHVAWAAFEARQRCLDEMAANIRDFLEGGRRGRVV
ncbi:MAG TPA: D-2-hydroxyacid dehydrogenase [Steroidobacteraceae bacterium]|nr:D-2-hydroxyacid dehydrogenase [Steroidobacteraceae bacterium]